jgi:hypothetical protein
MLPNRNECFWRWTKTAWCWLAAGLMMTAAVLAQDSASVRRLFEQLRSQDPLRRGEAARTLLQIAPNATAALEVFLEALLDADESVRQTAAEALVRMGPKIVPDLAKVLEGPSKTLRRRVAVVLGQMGPAAKAAVPALEKALQDADGDTRAFAALALVRIHPARADLVPLLRPLLHEPETSLRVSLVYALELLIKDQPDAIQLLEIATRDAVWEVRLAAVAVLGRAGKAAKSTQAALKQRLTMNMAWCGSVPFTPFCRLAKPARPSLCLSCKKSSSTTTLRCGERRCWCCPIAVSLVGRPSRNCKCWPRTIPIPWFATWPHKLSAF